MVQNVSLPPLSKRGLHNAQVVEGRLGDLIDLFRNQYDQETNPEGIVIAGVADNALMRNEVLRYINSDRLRMKAAELNYGDRFFTSTRMVEALCGLINEIPVGLSLEKPKLIEKVTPDQIVVGSGATGLLDALFTVLCDPGDGILLSVPYYNGFDHDLTSRAEARIVEVQASMPESSTGPNASTPDPSATMPIRIEDYARALRDARQTGVKVTSVLLCNPHNPFGRVYSREGLISLAKFAAQESLHLVVDEIYARSIFVSPDLPAAPDFESILSIDVEKEASLPRSSVHVISSASKDFGVNGFRLGIYINQGNQKVVEAMTSLGILSQASSPAAALFSTWLEDTSFLRWYFEENHRRMTHAYTYLTQWARHHHIPYVPANSGHFVMLDFRRFLPRQDEARAAEAALSKRLLEAGIFIAPGGQYHHPDPGWFRFTFSISAVAAQEGLKRTERALSLPSFASSQVVTDFSVGSLPLPARA